MFDGGTGREEIALAYSTDGVTWVKYDGATVNGNTNPVILSGEDNFGEDWENRWGISRLTEPTLLYEDDTFYLFYISNGGGQGNNRGAMGLATFQWDNEADTVVNLHRNLENPLLFPSQDSEFKSGLGHIDVSKADGAYYLYAIRENLSFKGAAGIKGRKEKYIEVLFILYS